MIRNTPNTTEFQEIRIPAGHHAAQPRWFDYKKRDWLGMQFVFTDYASYELPGVDQEDWNKLCGLSFCLFSNHRNSVMVSWRWNPDDELFELGFYYHVRGKRVIRKDYDGMEVFARVRPRGTCFVNFKVDHLMGVVYTNITVGEEQFTDSVELKTNRRSRVINTWFGGNRAAPNDIYLLRKLL
jgi:hypothetical protein